MRYDKHIKQYEEVLQKLELWFEHGTMKETEYLARKEYCNDTIQMYKEKQQKAIERKQRRI